MSEMAYSQTNDVQDMVLLHGWGANKQIWQAWAEASFPHYRLWLIDLPGHGERDSVQIMPEESLISAWCRDMLSQMPEQAIVLGWSLGGLIAQSIALIYPERVSALILLATSPCFVQKEAWLPALEQQAFDTYLIDLERDPLELFKAFSLLQSLGSSRPKQLSKQLIQEVTTMPAQQDALAQGLTLLGELDYRAQLRSLRMPCLWLLAEADAIVPYALADALVVLHPQSQIKKISQAGHLPFITQAEQTQQAILDFLD